MTAFYFGVTAVSFIGIFLTADIIVKSSSAIADRYGISHLFIGIALVGLGTSAPEVFVTAIASFLNHPQIVMGNASGSIAANAGVAMALIFWIVSAHKDSGKTYIADGRTVLLNALFLPVAAALAMWLTRQPQKPARSHR